MNDRRTGVADRETGVEAHTRATDRDLSFDFTDVCLDCDADGGGGGSAGPMGVASSSLPPKLVMKSGAAWT